MKDDLETRLVKLARAGDRGAFNELVNLYTPRMYHLCYRMIGNKQEAEDLVQETFLRVFHHLERFDEVHKFSTWIYRIATNLCIDRIRKRRPIYSLDAEVMDGEGHATEWHSIMPGDQDMPEKELILNETQDEVRDLVDQLPDKYKAAIVLRYYQDLSLTEISDVLQLPVTTVKTRLHRGREVLRKKMEFKKLF